MQIDLARYRVKIAETEVERAGARRLRYKVFVEELGAQPRPEECRLRQEWDDYDALFDHLILLDEHARGDPLDRVVGVYRLMTAEALEAGAGFYGEREYDLTPLKVSGPKLVELGRTCVAREHRGGAAMLLLWNGLASYVLGRKIDIMFGVASFPGVDPEPYAEALSHLHHAHLAPPELRVRALEAGRLEMDRVPPDEVDPVRALKAVPPLIKAYLRLGGCVGDGAFIDRQFNTIDVFVLMETARMTDKYRNFYERGWEARK